LIVQFHRQWMKPNLARHAFQIGKSVQPIRASTHLINDGLPFDRQPMSFGNDKKGNWTTCQIVISLCTNERRYSGPYWHVNEKIIIVKNVNAHPHDGGQTICSSHDDLTS